MLPDHFHVPCRLERLLFLRLEGIGRKKLDRDCAFQLRVLRLVHDILPALTEFLKNLDVRYGLADHYLSITFVTTDSRGLSRSENLFFATELTENTESYSLSENSVFSVAKIAFSLSLPFAVRLFLNPQSFLISSSASSKNVGMPSSR